VTEQRRLSVRDAAERAGVSMKVIRRAIESGELPGYRSAACVKVVVLEADVDRVFPLERIEPRAPAPPPTRRVPVTRRPPARGSREALRSIEGRAAR
jgi:excisionase family DNA binding protein